MSICNRDCLHCPHPDCVCDEMDYSDYREADRIEREIIRPRTAKQERIAARKRAWDQANRDYYRAYREANRAHLLAYRRKYRDANRERLRAYDRAYRRRKREEAANHAQIDP